MLKGYKTYVTGALAILGAIAAYETGDATIIQTAQLVFTAILGMTVRHAID